MMSNPSEPAKRYQCHCGTGFSRIENYRRHQRKHENKAYLKCEVCNREFSRPDMLQKHARVHNKETSRAASMGSAEVAPETTAESSLSAPQSEEVLTVNAPLQPPEQSLIADGATIGMLPPTDLDSQVFIDGLSWDTGLDWILQDSGFLLDALWTGTSPSDPQLQRTAPVLVRETLTINPISGVAAPSRPSSPPVNADQEDRWPTNHRPGLAQPFALGSGEVLAEVDIAPRLVPDLARYERFWLSPEMYEQVKTSLSIAGMVPGPSMESFRMPNSLDTVNTFISIFFQHFHSHLPILHLPTFSPTEVPALLLAVTIAIGANYSGLRGARTFNVDMVEVIRRALGVIFEIDSTQMRNQHLIHVALLNTLAGILSGHQRTFELAEASRGQLIHLCRRAELLDSPMEPSTLYASMMTDSVDTRWRRWAMAEQGKRIGLAACLLDSFFPAFFDTPSYASQGEMLTTILPSDERFWNAESAQTWQALLGLAPIPPSPYFAAAVSAILTPKYAIPAPQPIPNLNPFAALCVVNALHHHVYEYTAQLAVYASMGLTVPNFQPNTLRPPEQQAAVDPGSGFEGRRMWLAESLEVWKVQYYGGQTGSDPGHPLLQAGRVLYHIGHIALNIHIRDLYAVAGKFGTQKQESARGRLSAWALTAEADAASNHSIDLLNALDFPNTNHLIYSAPAGFLAILCLWAYITCRTSERGVPAHIVTRLRQAGGVKDGNDFLSLGAKFLGQCRVWRIGPAYMLILAKLRI